MNNAICGNKEKSCNFCKKAVKLCKKEEKSLVVVDNMEIRK